VCARACVCVCVAPLAPEIIPPITRVVTYTKSSRPVQAKFGSVQPPMTSATGPRSVGGADVGRGWTGGDFTPANRMPVSEQSSTRTKRYSSQRLRSIASDSGPADASAHAAAAGNGSRASVGVATRLVNATSMIPMPSRPPVPGSPFYGMT